jgi:NAD-dependent DNA ligase
MKDKTFERTGFSDDSEAAYTQTIIAAGGTVKSSTVLATDYVVYNPDYGHETTKLKRAKELIARGKPITILTEEGFLKKQ